MLSSTIQDEPATSHDPAMSGEELRAARIKLGWNVEEMAERLGFRGEGGGDHVLRLEHGKREISGTIKKLVELYLRGSAP